MPVQFTCQHCDSTLSVSSRKSGLEVTCPKCRQRTLVPAQAPIGSAVVNESASPESFGIADSLAEPDVVASPPVADALPWSATEDEVTWVYEDEKPTLAIDDQHLLIDYDKIALPRYVIYGQGALLGAIAVTSLVLGILIGRSTQPPVASVGGPATPCYVTGKVQYASSSGAKTADVGAVVIIVPQDERPTEKAPIEGLRPDDPLPSENQPAVSRIKAIGGEYTRVDDQGNFKLRVPNTGEYFVLVLSRNAARKGSEKLDSVHLAQMGRYFLPAPDLIGDRRYIWQAESIKRDRDLKFTLE